MRKIPYQDFLKSMTMFFVNDTVDKKFVRLRQEKINHLKASMSNINTHDGLVEFIKLNENSLSYLLIILGVSTEFFKRVISMFRIQSGLLFSTEWDARQARNYIISHPVMMEKVCDLFLKGNKDPKLKSHIPGFKLENFIINDHVMARLNNEDFLAFLINKDFDTQYNAEISNLNISKIDVRLSEICELLGFKLVRQLKIDPAGNGTRDILANYAIVSPSIKLPLFYIKYSFNITTSNGQTTFKRSVKDLRDYIRNNNPQAKQITILDGAGWVGRQSDLRDVWDYSDYCLNLQHLDELSEIIKQ